MTDNFWKCKTDFTKYNINSRKIYFHKGEIIWYTRYNPDGTTYLHIYISGFSFDFPDFNIEDYVEPLGGTEKELADIFINAQEEIDKVAESFNPVPATKEQKERLEKLYEGLVKHEPTAIEKMSDNELCRKLDIARRNVEKWQKRIDDIQRERSSRYCYRKSMQDPDKSAFRSLLHPFKNGFWCQMCIVTDSYYTKHPYLGMLWEDYDTYAGDSDYGWDYCWTGNRKTWKQLKWYKKFGIDDEGFVFTIPFFIAYLLVLPGTLYHIYELNKEMKDYEEYHRTHYFNEDTMTWEEKK